MNPHDSCQQLCYCCEEWNKYIRRSSTAVMTPVCRLQVEISVELVLYVHFITLENDIEKVRVYLSIENCVWYTLSSNLKVEEWVIKISSCHNKKNWETLYEGLSPCKEALGETKLAKLLAAWLSTRVRPVSRSSSRRTLRHFQLGRTNMGTPCKGPDERAKGARARPHASVFRGRGS